MAYLALTRRIELKSLATGTQTASPRARPDQEGEKLGVCRPRDSELEPIAARATEIYSSLNEAAGRAGSRKLCLAHGEAR